MDVVIPHLLDTGVAKRRDDGSIEVNLDCAACIEVLVDDQIKIFKWKENRIGPDFLFIVKAWKTPFGKVRKLRLQCHKIRNDGSWGRRIILREISNGRIIR